MKLFVLLGILAICYGVVVFYIAFKKPKKIWEMTKIKGFIKVLGEKGTIIFFYIWGILFVGVGIWLIITKI